MFVLFALFARFVQSYSRFLNFLAQGLKVVPGGRLSTLQVRDPEIAGTEFCIVGATPEGICRNKCHCTSYQV